MKYDASFDKEKSDRTKKARGIDFLEARAIWDDPHHKDIPVKNVNGEVRFGTVGMIENKLWIALWTERNGIRIFSVHRAENTRFERAYYEGK